MCGVVFHPIVDICSPYSPYQHRSKRRRIDVMQFIDIAAAEAEDEDDYDDDIDDEDEGFVAEDGL